MKTAVARRLAVLAVLVACACLTACAGVVVRESPEPSTREALLVLPGFGYSRDAQKALRALAPAMAADGIDLFVPTYVSRSGIAASRVNLEHFIRDRQLNRYRRVHVFAFIAGAWTLNPLVAAGGLPNLATVIYDRSPLQERAPAIAIDKLHFLTWLRYGSPVFDLARTPYAALTAPNVRIALMVETRPTSFIQRYEKAARDYGPFRFECDAFGQRFDDCLFLPMTHDDLYTRFAELWPEVLAFIRAGRFTTGANRTPPTGDPFARDTTH